jgi:hypothetical protein
MKEARYLIKGKPYRNLNEVAAALGIWYRPAYDAMVRAIMARRAVMGVHVLTRDDYLERSAEYERRISGSWLIRRPVVHGLGCLHK